MSTVEVFWPASLPRDGLELAQTAFDDEGVPAMVRLEPPRRGVADWSVVVVIAAPILEPFLKSIFEMAGRDAHQALGRLLSRLFSSVRSDQAVAPAAATSTSVIFESATTHAKFVFTPGLPEEAYRQALTLQPVAGSRMVWDAAERKWSRITDS